MREALDSIADLQGLSGYDVAVVLSNDASTDDSVEVFRTWARSFAGTLKVRFVSRETNGGTAAALNSGIEAVPEAEWIWPLAADDCIMPDALSEWEHAKSKGADAMPAGYQAFGCDSNGKPIDEASTKSRRLYTVTNPVEGFRRGNHLSSGCSPFRRRFWEMVGFDEDLRTAEDTLFWLRIARRGAHFVPSRRPVVRVRYHLLRKSFTPVARDRKTKIRAIRERMESPVCDFLASERHFAEHLAPIWRALAPWARGRFLVPKGLRDYASNILGVRAVAYRKNDLFDLLKADSVMTATASAGDQQQAAVAGRWTVYSEHGTGQTYQRRHSSYANWPHRRSVALILAPGAQPAAQFRANYPKVPVVEIGSPMLDDWQLGKLEQPKGDVVAISFHWNCNVQPETTSAWQHYEKILPELKEHFNIIGHAHPRIADKMRQVYAKAGIDFVETFDEVLMRASVYCVDNSSTLFAFAAAAPPGESRPVVVLNCPAYRKGVNHGMRFWEYADIGIQVGRPEELIPAIALTLQEAGLVSSTNSNLLLSNMSQQRDRKTILDAVYSVRDGTAASVAARAIERALGQPWPPQTGHPKNRRLRAQQVTRFDPRKQNTNGAMLEPKTVRMIANVTFTNKQHEGQVRRRSTFFTTERRAKALEKHGHARRSAVGPTMTKPKKPLITKAEARKVLGYSKMPTPTPVSDFTRDTLKKALDMFGVKYKKIDSKPELYRKYLEHHKVSA